MTTYGLSRPVGTLSPLAERWAEAMRSDRAVQITAIIAGTLVVLGMLTAAVVLVFLGKDTAALLALVNLIVTSVVGKVAVEAKAEAKAAKENSNGTNAKLVDYATSSGGGDS